MFKFLHRKALENSISDIENCIRQYPEWDYAGPMSDVMTETLKILPKGLSQTPCPATRAYCVDLVRLANKAHGIGLVNVWLALTALNLYFSSWDIAYHDPKDYKAVSIKNRARGIIDRFYEPNPVSKIGFQTEPSDVVQFASKVMTGFLEKIGVYNTPLKLMKPTVLAYVYGWCDAATQSQKPDLDKGLIIMLGMFDAIYGKIKFAEGEHVPELGAMAYKQALNIIKNPNSRYASWIRMGGNELNEYLENGTSPIGILEALEAAI